MVETIKKDLENMLTNFRYEHSLLVAEEARLLAKHYNLDSEKAYLAGLVHDIAKDLMQEEEVYYINKYNIEYNKEYNEVLHSIIGYYLVKEKYNLDDEICNSIKYHTLGNTNMTLFDKIIFVADKIGRVNKNSFLDNIKLLAYKDIDSAIKECLEYVEKKLHKLNKPFHEDSIRLLEQLKK